MIDIDLDRVSIPLQWPALFARDAPTDIEIGAGKGKFFNELAALRPDRNLLAVERSAKYHRLCCDRAARRGLTNVRLLRTTGEDLLFRLITEVSVETIYVLFPDPWPKKRHHKRRLIKPEIVAAMARALTVSGRLLVKSDHGDYAKIIGEVLAGESSLTSINPDEAFAGLPLTGFEHKYEIEGRVIHAFAFEKRA